MSVFSWKGEIDTIMKPIDSMRYTKRFLHPGMMSMDPLTGPVQAWVVGMNYRRFQYDNVTLLIKYHKRHRLYTG